jgi:CCR4-NOT transcription complex subunit 6
VLAGDFNSLPGSDPHTLLSSGGVTPDSGDSGGLLQVRLAPLAPACNASMTRVSLSHQRQPSHHHAPDHLLRRHHPPQAPDPTFQGLPLRHALPLRSALATVGAHVNASAESHELQKMEPPYTNFTAHFVGTLDYMWYTYDRLSVGGLMEMVEDRLVQETTALPSPTFSSDHVPLLAEYYFKR